MKILLIDDSKVTRYALRIELKKLGVEVATADSAEAALETLKSRVPDAILMDHIMPGLNGLEALEIIRADPRTAHLPIVLCTSQEDADFAAAAGKKGVLAILPKSLAAERLPGIIARIRAALESIASGSTAAVPAGSDAGSQAAVDVPAPSHAPSEPELIALIDERLEAGINKRLTALIEALRRDLTEMLIAEAGHLVETRLAEERAALADAQPPASLQDLGGLEARLTSEILPELIHQRVAAALAQLRPELVDDLRRSLPDPSASAGWGSTEPMSGSSGSVHDAGPIPERLRDMATTAIQTLRAALKRPER